jgi:hypothetical protein
MGKNTKANRIQSNSTQDNTTTLHPDPSPVSILQVPARSDMNSVKANKKTNSDTSTNPNHVRIHIEAQHEYLEEHNYVHRILHLQQNPNEELAESVDRMRMRACLYAESKIPQYPDVPYSPAMVEARNYFGLLCLLLHQHKTTLN